MTIKIYNIKPGTAKATKTHVIQLFHAKKYEICSPKYSLSIDILEKVQDFPSSR